MTPDYRGDRETVVRVLNQALATELVCVLRYMRHHYMAKGIHSQAVAEEFLEHVNEEEHAEDMKTLLETIWKEEKQRDHR